MRLAKILGFIGRTCITAGVLILLFVVYQLWGTGLRTAQAQDDLEAQFEQQLAEAPTTTTEPPDESTTTTTAPPDEPTTTTKPETVPTIAAVPEGDPTAQIVIPDIGVDYTVVEGVSLADLKKGPGHFPLTPLPGQEGNAAIAGHRTTYGAPFNRLDELQPGDEIFVTTVQGEFRYLVEDTEGDGNGNHIVKPTQVEVLKDFGDNRLTLSACHPKYSARERIIVVAQLAPDEKPQPRPAKSEAAAPPSFEDIDGEGASAWPAILWGVVCAAIWLLAWLVGRRWRKWPAYLIGLPFFLVALFFFFEEFSRLLPNTI